MRTFWKCIYHLWTYFNALDIVVVLLYIVSKELNIMKKHFYHSLFIFSLLPIVCIRCAVRCKTLTSLAFILKVMQIPVFCVSSLIYFDAALRASVKCWWQPVGPNNPSPTWTNYSLQCQTLDVITDERIGWFYNKQMTPCNNTAVCNRERNNRFIVTL